VVPNGGLHTFVHVGLPSPDMALLLLQRVSSTMLSTVPTVLPQEVDLVLHSCFSPQYQT
jgi:hypothetical protein